MSEERNTRREILKKVLTLGPLAALAAAFGNGAKPAQATDIPDNLNVGGILTVQGAGSSSIAGNVGIGVTPAGWDSGFRALQIGGTGAITAHAAAAGPGHALYIMQNAYYGGLPSSDWRYLADDAASRLLLAGGAFYVYTAPSGAAGNAITWTERVRIDNSGNVGIGVILAGWNSAFRALQIGGTGAIFAHAAAAAPGHAFYITQNAYYGGLPANFRYLADDAASRIGIAGGVFQFFTAPSGTAGYEITFTERVRIDNSGNVGIGTPSPVAKLDVLGDIRLTGSVLPVGGGVFEGKARRSYYDT